MYNLQEGTQCVLITLHKFCLSLELVVSYLTLDCNILKRNISLSLEAESC